MKPRFVIVMLLVLALAVPASMLAQQNSKAEKEVRAVLTEITEANMKGTGAVPIFEKYLADDYTRISDSGSVSTKADVLNGFKTGASTYQSLDLSDVKIRIYGKTAVVTGIVKGKGMTMGISDTDIPDRFTRVFVKRDGIWKSVLYQNTPLKQ